MQFTTIAATAALATLANAHGYFLEPKGREPGPRFQEECGMQAYYNLKGDINNNIQGLTNLMDQQDDVTEACRPWFCKGLKWFDNEDNYQTYHPGQTVDLYHNIQAPHDGYANVSIVRTEDAVVISPDLKKFEEYALTSRPTEDSQQHFSITMPEDLGDQCKWAGACVIQFFWDAPDPINQTYESCIDFELIAGGNAKREVRAHPRDFGA